MVKNMIPIRQIPYVLTESSDSSNDSEDLTLEQKIEELMTTYFPSSKPIPVPTKKLYPPPPPNSPQNYIVKK